MGTKPVSLFDELDSLERFFKARDYLDQRDSETVDRSTLELLLNDDSELTRAEAADFIIVFGCLPADAINDRITVEGSSLVRPRLWLALARTDPNMAEQVLRDVAVDGLSALERCYYEGALFLTGGNAAHLYALCSCAFSEDVPASYSAIDLLEVIAGERVGLLRELVADLERHQADNLQKAKSVFRIDA